MSEQPPVQPPDQPSNPPSSEPGNQPAAGTPPTQPMPAAGPPVGQPGPLAAPARLAGSPAAAASGYTPRPNVWSRTTSTHGGRWGLALAAGALALLLILVIGVAGIAVLRNHDRVDLLGNRQDRQFLSQDGRGNGQGPSANDKQDRKAQKQQDRKAQKLRERMEVPGMPFGRGQGLGGLGNLLGGTALHGDVTGTVNGSVQALVFQRGEVTAVSDTSITLKSSDGFVGTYGRNATTVSRGAAPVKGGQALVLARASDKVAITIMATPDMAGAAPIN